MWENAHIFLPEWLEQRSMLKAAAKSSGIWRRSKQKSINKPCDQFIVTRNTFSWSVTHLELVNKKACLQQRQTTKSTLSPFQVCLITPNYNPELRPLKGYYSSHGKWWEKDKHQTNRCAFGLWLSDGTFGIQAWGQSHCVCAEVAQTRRWGCQCRTTCQGIWVRFIPLWHLPVVSVPSAKSTLNNWNG